MTEPLNADVVIAGAGHAGGTAAAALRQAGFEGSILMIGDETHPPYERPPLSKAYLAGELAPERLLLRKPVFWTERSVDFLQGVRVVHLDRTAKTLHLSDDRTVTYQHLIIATGGSARPIPCPGADLVGVHYLRSIADVDGIKADLGQARRIAVVGGGYIGLEVAAVARKLGLEVTLIEALDRVLARVTSPTVSRFYESAHRARGVDIRLGTGVAAFEGSRRVHAVRLADGSEVPCDFVIVGIGIIPNVGFAADAGLAVENGIAVDEVCTSSDPAIFAIGDCAAHVNIHAGKRIRLESVQNAVDQAKTAVAAIMGTPKPYRDLPWFWSDQYDIKLQTAGLAMDYDDTVVRGDPTAPGFSVVYLRQGRIIAIDAINAIKDFMAAKSLIVAGIAPDRARLADPAVALKDFLPPSDQKA